MGTVGDNLELDDAAQRRQPRPLAHVDPTPVPPMPSVRARRWQPGKAWSRIASAARLAFEEEEAHGHLFLLYPVFMIVGAVWWFSAISDPSPVRLVAWAIVLLPCHYLTSRQPALTRLPVRLATFVLLGASASWLQTLRAETVVIDGPVSTTVTARIVDVEMREEGRWRYIVEVLKTESPRLKRPPSAALLGLRGSVEAFLPGTVIRGFVRLQPPAGPALPGLNDFAFDSYFKGIGAIGGFLGQPVVLANQREQRQNSVLAAFAEGLSSVRSAINQRVLSVLPGDTGAFASALITNDTAAFSKEGLEALRVSGLAHVISISGLHMVLAAGISFVGLRMAFSLFPGFIQTRPAKTYAAIGAIVTSGLYLLISGMPVSAVRSFIMLAVGMGGVLVARTVLTLRSVALAAMAILLVSPASALGPSFQMSFGAAAALISGYSLWRLRPVELSRLRGLPFYGTALPAIRAVGGVMLTSQIAGLATAIFSVTHFHRLTLLGTLGNVAAMPFISFVVMPAGFAAVLLMPLGLDYYPLRIMGLGLDATMWAAHQVSSLGGDITVGQLEPWALPLASAAFLASILPRTRPFRLAGASLFAGALLMIALFGPVRKPDLVIAEAADMVGIISGKTLATNLPRPPSFIMDQWARALVVRDVVKPQITPAIALERQGARKPLTDADEWKVEDTMEEMGNAVQPGEIACSGRDWCVGRLPNGSLIITFADFAFQGPACRQADIAIAAAFLRVPKCGQGEAMLFDRNMLRSRGALSVYIDRTSQPAAIGESASRSPQLTIVGAIDGRNRPWNRHRYYDWRRNSYAVPFTDDQ